MEDPCEGFRWTEIGVVGGTLANDFAFDSILLVSEGNANICDVSKGVHVIQEGGLGAGVRAALVSESDVLEFEGLGT